MKDFAIGVAVTLIVLATFAIGAACQVRGQYECNRRLGDYQSLAANATLDKTPRVKAVIWWLTQ